MALNFLSKGLNFLSKNAGPISNILGAIQGIAGGGAQEKAENRILNMAINRPASESERYAISMQKALADPNNSLINQLQQEDYQLLMNAINQGIQGKVLSDRREAALGRRPTFFDPERADENIAYQLSRGAPQAMMQARQNALQRVQSAAGGVGGFSGAQEQRYQQELNALGSDYLRKYGEGAQNPMNNIQQILQALQGFGRTGGISPSNYGRTIANPNIRGTKYMV